MTVVQLKVLLGERCLKKSGRKAELVDRLEKWDEENVKNDEETNNIPDGYYELTSVYSDLSLEFIIEDGQLNEATYHSTVSTSELWVENGFFYW